MYSNVFPMLRFVSNFASMHSVDILSRYDFDAGMQAESYLPTNNGSIK